MTCEQAAQHIIDDLTGNLAPAEARQLRDHLATCDACRAEAGGLEQTWADLGRLASPAAGPSGVARLAERLAPSDGAGRAPVGSRRRLAPMALALAASVLVGLFAGYQAGRAGGDAPVQPGLGSEYLLLLRGPPGGLRVAGVSESELVEEYRDWALALQEEDVLLGAERLAASSGLWVAGVEGRRVAPELADAPFISGYFLVRVPDADAALAAARLGPHIKYGGTIEIREIAVN